MEHMRRETVALTIAGSDSGGGAGIQADIKTFSACGVFGASVITAITAQNLDGVSAIQPVNPEVVSAQLEMVLAGFPVRAVKTGMLFSREIIEIVAGILQGHPEIPIVVDPVFAATSGSRLIREDAVSALVELLFPRALLVTPNLPEAEILLGEKGIGVEDMGSAATRLRKKLGVNVLLKGGHLKDTALDVLATDRGVRTFEIPRVEGVNSHGSGCTFASAVAAFLARDFSLEAAVEAAKEYTTRTLIYSLPLKNGLQVMNHFWRFSEYQ